MSTVELVSTGIPGLDEQLGGLPNSSLFLLVGGIGSGVEVFAQQILYNKVREGNKVMYFTTDRPPNEIEEDMGLFGWSIKDMKNDNLWFFVDAYAPRFVRATRISTVTLFRTDFIPKIEKGMFTTVDNLSHMLLRFDARDVLDTIELLRNKVREVGGLHFLILWKGVHEQRLVTTIAHIVDGVLEFRTLERAREIERFLRIKKMRGVIYGITVMPYRITEDGIIIETAIRIA